jgi:hypothetical protein
MIIFPSILVIIICNNSMIVIMSNLIIGVLKILIIVIFSNSTITKLSYSFSPIFNNLIIIIYKRFYSRILWLLNFYSWKENIFCKLYIYGKFKANSFIFIFPLVAIRVMSSNNNEWPKNTKSWTFTTKRPMIPTYYMEV